MVRNLSMKYQARTLQHQHATQMERKWLISCYLEAFHSLEDLADVILSRNLDLSIRYPVLQSSEIELETAAVLNRTSVDRPHI